MKLSACNPTYNSTGRWNWCKAGARIAGSASCKLICKLWSENYKCIISSFIGGTPVKGPIQVTDSNSTAYCLALNTGFMSAAKLHVAAQGSHEFPAHPPYSCAAVGSEQVTGHDQLNALFYVLQR